MDWFDINKRKERVGTNCALPSILFNIEDNVDFEFGGEIYVSLLFITILIL